MSAKKVGLAAALAAAALAGLAAPAAATAAPINHVFVIVLENENAESTFGEGSEAPYLAQTLRSQGAYLPNYYAIGHLSLDNYIAMVSGQAPNLVTQADCPVFLDFLLGLPAPDGQVIGQGCVYPASVPTIANTLEQSGYSWKGYMEDMAAKAPAEPAGCRHPAVNGVDSTQTAELGDQYAARHNPFVYFHSIIDTPSCAANDVDLTELPGDLASVESTANYSFISPNLCNDGHDAPCVDGRPGGLESANEWLEAYVPQILGSPAYRNNGLLIVTFDEAETGPGADGDASACCDEQPGPNTINPGGLVLGPGGGRIGAVALSPCIAPGTVDETPYNHYSLLKSVEGYFGLPLLGYSGNPGLSSFGDAVFTRPECVDPNATPAGGMTSSAAARKKRCAKRRLKGKKRARARKRCKRKHRKHRKRRRH